MRAAAPLRARMPRVSARVVWRSVHLMKCAFELIDADGSGAISAAEMRAVLSLAGVALTVVDSVVARMRGNDVLFDRFLRIVSQELMTDTTISGKMLGARARSCPGGRSPRLRMPRPRLPHGCARRLRFV